jgi:hypothetical protein
MSDFDLLSAVQPPDGWFAILGIHSDKTVRQTLVATREEVDKLVAKFMTQKRNVFFGVAKFATGENRTKKNVQSLKAFWLDIDCGEGKAEIDPDTGRPKGYVDQATGLRALRDFCTLIGLPKPTLVNSGRGIHVYWILDRVVSPQEWEPVGARLRKLCETHNFYVDPDVFDTSRVLRIPGTLNFKDDPPKAVTVMSVADPVAFDELRRILGVEETAVTESKAKRELTALGKAMLGNVESKFSTIMVRSAKGSGCKQLLSCFQDRATLEEPRWFNALSIAKFCSDRDTAIHKLSQGHPDYDYAVVEKKAQGIKGPHSCVEFEAKNPGGCEGCPHKGKITSPIVLGKEIARATEEDNNIEVEVADGEVETHHIPAYPFPFFRGKTGGIYMQGEGDEDEPVIVYEHDLYVVKRMRDPVLGDVVVMRLHLPKDGVKEFVITNAQMADKSEPRKLLASQGVICTEKRFGLLLLYIQASIKELQYQRKAEQMRTQFGWADNDSKFIVGDREITKDGVFHSPPSSITANIAQYLTSKGTLEKWQEVFNLYGRPGLEPHAFAALTAFGSPLLKFLGQNGAIINVVHPKSGTGKTTILQMCNSVFGNPEKLSAMWNDTINAKIMRLGIMNNLAFTVDEMTNTTPQDFSTLAYSMSQGRGKDRVKASANEMRLNLTSWAAMSLCSSNAAFYEKMTSLKDSPDGELMRLMEYKIDYSNAVDPAYAKEMFDHQLKENYGHAGDIYVTWLVSNLEEAIQTARNIQGKIDKELQLTQRERFWSAATAANIAGGLIAKHLKLIDWDMKRIYMWATKMVLSLREDMTPPVNDVSAIIGDYVNRHMQNIIVVNDEADRRANRAVTPVLEPKGNLLIRYEPDTKKMFLAAKSFKDDCVKFQINYKETLRKLEEKGIYVGTTNKRLSKGMAVIAPGVHSIVLDCSGTEVLNMDGFFGTGEQKDEGGKS